MSKFEKVSRFFHYNRWGFQYFNKWKKHTRDICDEKNKTKDKTKDERRNRADIFTECIYLKRFHNQMEMYFNETNKRIRICGSAVHFRTNSSFLKWTYPLAVSLLSRSIHQNGSDGAFNNLFTKILILDFIQMWSFLEHFESLHICTGKVYFAGSLQTGLIEYRDV